MFLADIDVPAEESAKEEVDEDDFAQFAFAAAVRAPESANDLDPLWTHWNALSLPVQVASAQAFARAGHPPHRVR